MPQNRSSAFTLLETLLVLSLMVFIMGIIWGMMRLYSSNYLATEKRVSRAQLVRSIAEMLRDDLDAAIQDPIHPLLEKAQGSVPIRRFGLRGTSHSVQFDAVQNVPFLTEEISEDKKRKKGQVPELKTIFYEFIPPYEREKKQTAKESDSSLDMLSGSQMVGSLQAIPEDPNLNSSFAMESLVRKYGLSRRELDFETPFVDNSKESESHSADTQWLEAKDLVMEREDSVDWAPEVFDCRFEYFDGSKWIDHWDSIQMGGLPVAIGVALKLFSLDEMEQLRTDPLFVRWSEEKARLKDLGITQADAGSRIAGSLRDPNLIRSFSTAEGLPDLQDILKRIGLPDPMDRQVISWIPTTSLKNHQILERRKPISVKGGQTRSFNAFESVERKSKGERKTRERRQDPRFPDSASLGFSQRTLKDRTYRETEVHSEDVFSSLERGSEEMSAQLPLENYRSAQQTGTASGQTWIRGK